VTQSVHQEGALRNGQISRLRDYVNILATAAAMGRDM
jgi:ketosteroid isomerase-like protein